MFACGDDDASDDAGGRADLGGVDLGGEDATLDSAVEDVGIDVFSSDSALDSAVEDVGVDGSSDSGMDLGSDSCVPLTNDTAPKDDECGEGAPCPAGYTCQAFAGIVLQMSCQVLCTSDCDCPSGTRCETVADKAGSWMQCNWLPD